MPKTIPLAVLTIMLSLAVSAPPVGAQINPFNRSGFSLAPQDVTLIKAAAAKLYEGETAELGSQETWANPESGNRGSVALAKIFTHKGLRCRRLQHDIVVKDVADSFRFIIDRCRVTSGEWKIL